MKTVRVNKGELIQIITENKRKHRDLFSKAFDGYRLECIAILTENLNSLQKGICRAVIFHEQAPEDHSEDYNTVLNMLNMSTDSIIELTHQEFQQYVEDNWNWRERWAASNMKYYAAK